FSVPVILFLAALSILLFLRHTRLDVFFSTDEGNKFIQVQNLARSGDFAIAYPGRDIDPGFRFFPYAGNHFISIGGKFYSYHPFYFPYLMVPFYRGFGVAGLYLAPAFFTLLALLFFQ